MPARLRPHRIYFYPFSADGLLIGFVEKVKIVEVVQIELPEEWRVRLPVDGASKLSRLIQKATYTLLEIGCLVPWIMLWKRDSGLQAPLQLSRTIRKTAAPSTYGLYYAPCYLARL